ncbi:MAG: hypothetical protein EPO07_11770 [Verrucomicrobia bacterium]|nr:MAG: hypothetical protein EPO07_11770 [Verrucomicrobiota bacterium]
MRDPGNNHIKAWAREYEEEPFFFEQDSAHGKRIVAWSEEPDQTKGAFYSLIEAFPDEIEVLLKISAEIGLDGKPLWSRFYGLLQREHAISVIRSQEEYAFSDGMNQICIKDPNSEKYFAFDEHGIFFVYSPHSDDMEIFRSLKFGERYAEPIYSMPHFHHTSEESEKMEMKFVTSLGLKSDDSDLD